MFNTVPAVLPTGAYVIRDLTSSTVLHSRYPDATDENTSVQVYQQDEGQFKDQQIWWVEPLAHYADPTDSQGVVYSITSPGSGKALGADPESRWVYANQNRGEPWQRWSLRKSMHPRNGGIPYSIVNVLTGKVLDIDSENPRSGAWVNIQQACIFRGQNRWEFAIPIAAFPPGWFHIQSAGTGELLSHDYDHNVPVLLPAPEPMIESQYRRQWQFQWTLSHSKCFKSGTAGERNSWYIINRLTRKPLSPQLGRFMEKDYAGREENLAWKLELDSDCNWKITNRKTSCLLQRTNTVRSDGVAVGCSEQKFVQTGGRLSWILRPPVLSTNDDTAPPEYTTAA